jgi:hypothetical protein
MSKWEKRAEKKAEKKKVKTILAQTKGQKRELSPLSQDEDDDMERQDGRGGSPVKLTKKTHSFLK